MPNSLSANKRVRQSLKRRGLNNRRELRVKNAVKAFLTAVHDGDAAKAQELYRTTVKTLDQIAAKGTIHKNAAARRKSRLAKRLAAMSKPAAA